MRYCLVTTLRLGALVSLALTGCTAMQQGPPIELVDVAVPKVVSDVALTPKPALIPPPAVLPASRSSFKAWIPRRVTPNGDVHEGHYVEVSDKAPQKELTKPDYEIPKAPKQLYRPQVKKDTSPSQGSPSVPPPSPFPPPLPSSQGPLPPGFPLLQEGAHGLP